MHFATELAEKLAHYEKAWSALRAEAGLAPVKRAAVLEHLGGPDGTSCKDYHKQCPWWADKVPLSVPAVSSCRLCRIVLLETCHFVSEHLSSKSRASLVAQMYLV